MGAFLAFSPPRGYIAETTVSRSVETVGTIPWIVPFIRLLNMPNKMSRLAEQGKQALERRRKDGSEYKDLFHYLVRFASDHDWLMKAKRTL